MKRIVYLLGFILFVSFIFAFTSTHKEQSKIKQSPAHKQETETPIEKEIEPILITDSYLQLWDDEAKSESLNPTGLDTIHFGEELNSYRNDYHGYSFKYPSKWKIDNHQVPNYTRLYHRNFRIDITRQDPGKAWTSKSKFIEKTIEPIQDLITSDTYLTINNRKVREVQYQREPIAGIDNDLTHYSYYFINSDDYVYTFQLKTDNENYLQKKEQVIILIESMQLFDADNVDLEAETKKTAIHNPFIQYKHEQNSLAIPPNHFMLGVYTNNSYDIHSINSMLDAHIGSQMFYKPIDSTYDHYVQEMVNEQRLPIITFILQRANQSDEFDINEQILNGAFDDKIMSWAKQIKSTQSPVLIRMGNEMNGDWSEWSLQYNYNDPDIYKMTFRHYVNVFRSIEADNAYFVWNPNNNSDPYFEWNDAAMFYPGDAFVDWVGLTAYNFGKTKWGNFRSFESLYDHLYYEYLRAYSAKPMIIGEFGSVETGGDKGAFINEFFTKIPERYTNIKLAVWFDKSHDPYDFSINTSSDSIEAFKTGLQNENIIQYLEKSNK